MTMAVKYRPRIEQRIPFKTPSTSSLVADPGREEAPASESWI